MTAQTPPTLPPHYPASFPHQKRATVSEDVEKQRLVHMVQPMYPPCASKCVVGTVVLRVIIGEDGAVAKAQYVSGPLELKKPAIDAVKQWRYQPTQINMEPVQVETTVSLVFPAPEKPKPKTPQK
jgi:periplasmic protein TonB